MDMERNTIALRFLAYKLVADKKTSPEAIHEMY